MIIFEISRNGKTISQAGGKFIEMINTSVSYLKDKNRIRLVSAGLSEPGKKHREFVHWFEEVPLQPGDEIRIRIMDGDNPDTPVVDKHYGDVFLEDGTTEHYCSFCGTKAGADVSVLVSQNANICHDCLRKHNPDKVST